MYRFFLPILAVLLTVLPPTASAAGEALAAVASNFAKPVERLVADSGDRTGHRVRLSLGSTGKLYSQIVHGGPFDLFLAADQARPARLLADGLAVAGSQSTYALGRLVLVRADGGTAAPAILRQDGFRRLAIANPKLAPYGVAAEQAIDALGLTARLRGKLVFAENIAQAAAMVATGNAEAGLIAASLVSGPAWPVPAHLHAPIRQDAVLLMRGRNNPAAMGFIAYLQSAEGRATIRAFGFGEDRPAND